MQRTAKSENLGRDILGRLSNEEWVDLYNRLRLFIAHQYYGLLADDDLIAQAFLDVMEGKRTWDASKLPFENLRLIIRSRASNQLERQKKTVSFEEYQSSPGVTGFSLPGLAKSSQADVLEQTQSIGTLTQRLYQATEGDSLLSQILDYLIPNPHWKPQEMAKDLGVSTSDIYNARKRLLRRVKSNL